MLKAMCSFGKSKKGFTLIELLIVVAIIAILAAIAIPQFSSYRKRGYNAASTSDLRNIRTTEEAMMADFNDYGVSKAADPDAGAYGSGTAVTGAMLYLVGALTQSRPPLTVSLSPSVRAITATNGTASTRSDKYTAGTTHESGDQFYAAASGTTTLVRRGDETQANLDALINGATIGDNPTGNNWLSM